MVKYNIFIFNQEKMLMLRGRHLNGLGSKHAWGSDSPFWRGKSDADSTSWALRPPARETLSTEEQGRQNHSDCPGSTYHAKPPPLSLSVDNPVQNLNPSVTCDSCRTPLWTRLWFLSLETTPNTRGKTREGLNPGFCVVYVFFSHPAVFSLPPLYCSYHKPHAK